MNPIEYVPARKETIHMVTSRAPRKRKAWTRRQLPPPPAAPIHPELLYTQDEAAAFLRVSPRTLEEWRPKNHGPRYVKQGRLVRYVGSALLAFTATLRASGAAA